MIVPLLLGIVLAISALGYVLYPLFREPDAASSAKKRTDHIPPLRASGESRESIDALREIEFDRATGKLSESDYSALKEQYTNEALARMRTEDALHSASGTGGEGNTLEAQPAVDEVEALVSRFRAKAHPCGTCGPRTEPDAIYCSTCGCFLGGNCFRCGAGVTELGARFCSGCGAALAA